METSKNQVRDDIQKNLKVFIKVEKKTKLIEALGNLKKIFMKNLEN